MFGARTKMPDYGQVLLPKRRNFQQFKSICATDENIENDVTPVNKLTVRFPKVYFDQRYGYSLLKSEQGEFIADTANVDKFVKECMKTGNHDLETGNIHLEKPYQYDTEFNRQLSPKKKKKFKQKKFVAKELIPIKRHSSVQERSYSDSELDVKPARNGGNGASDYVEAEDVFHSEKQPMTFTAEQSSYDDEIPVDAALNDDETLFDDTYTDNVKDGDYVYLELSNLESLASFSHTDFTVEANDELNDIVTPHDDRSSGILRLKKVLVDWEDGDFDDDIADEEVYVDESNPEKMVIYRMTRDSELVQLRNASLLMSPGERSTLTRLSDYNQNDDDNIVSPIKFKYVYSDGKVSFEHKPINLYNPQTEAKKSAIKKRNEQLKQTVESSSLALNNAQEPERITRNRSHVSFHSDISVVEYSNFDKRDQPVLATAQPAIPKKKEAKAGPKPQKKAPQKEKHTESKKSINKRSKGKGSKKASKSHLISHNDNINLDQSTTGAESPEYIAQQQHVEPMHEAFALDAEYIAESDDSLSRMQQISIEKKLKYLEPPVYFYSPPDPQPLTMSFEYPGTSLTHKQVLQAVMKTLEYIPNAKITRLQFVARNVILGTMWVNNRWVMDLSTQQCVTVLSGRGILIKGEVIKLRKHDDVLKEDYTKFLLKKNSFNKKSSKKSPKPGSSRSHTKVSSLSLLKEETDADGEVSTLLGQSTNVQEMPVV